MDLGRPELFPEKKSFKIFLFICFILVLVRLAFLYMSYQEFITKPFYYTNVTVLSAYEKTKNSKSYTVLKLRSEEGFDFYTTSHKKEDFSQAKLRVQIFPNGSISFGDYLGTFYVKSKIKSKEKIANTFKDSLIQKVSAQHKSETLASFYNAIFFATPLDKELREQISMFGVSHLVALSGFHLSILWGLVYGFFLFLYKPLQQKYFPYRHALFDVGLVAMLVLGLYVWFVDFPPSLLRSYAMVLFGWLALIVGVELLSFTFLGT
ncbi:MAG: ComEC/Rec2 family competence protein, partial [Sulfurovum sp.]|nr:ComEC/Rec2 family competence protein [Sulfurovum sp.]